MPTAGKPIICRAAVAWEVNKPFSIEIVEVALPKKGEVRIKMSSTGVCHSDLHILEGIDKNYPFPGVFGHEGAGVVESVGEGVTSVEPGDVVVLLFESYCGECDYCKGTSTHLCRKTPRNCLQMDGTSRITCKGKLMSQMNSLSTFSEYTVTSEYNVAKEQAFLSSHPAWGRTVIIGLSDTGATMRAGIWKLIYGRQLLGTSYGSYKTRLGIPMLVDKVLKGQIQLEKLITHRLPLRRINDGFQMLTTGESLRAIIDFDLKE